MGSQLSNLRRPLEWTDFGEPKAGPDPAPGEVATAAKTRATHSHGMNTELVPGSSPHRFRLKDDVTVSVDLQKSQMFVNAWVFRRPKKFQDDLLHHEQGHYDLVALFIRDMFIEIMALKAQTFPTQTAILDAVNAIFKTFDKAIADVHKPYDDNTKHGREPDQQKRWDGFITTAFETPRDPPVLTPDGKLYKVPLLGVLQQGGVAI